MTTSIAPLPLPAVDQDWTSFVDARVDDQLDRSRDLVVRIKDGSQRSAADVLDLWNQSETAVANAESLVWSLAEIHPDASVRTLSEKRAQDTTSHLTDLGQDRALYDVFAALAADGLDRDQARLLERTLRDFRRSGVDRTDEVRSRLREISERLTVLGQDFGRTVRDDVRTVRVTPDRLAGLPQDFIDSHQPDDEGLVTLSTDYTDYVPVRTFAIDPDVRLDLTLEFLNRAWPANDGILTEIFDLRHEKARLLGYPDWPSYDAEVKMIATGPAIIDFIESITALSEDSARRDFDVLLRRAQRDDPAMTDVRSSDALFYREAISRENFAVDAQEVRRYFDFAKVRAGLLDVTGRLFGVEYRAVEDAPRWHEDVAVHDVYLDDALLGRIFLDLHPREGKYKHAAQFTVAPGVAGVQLPEGALVCNFSRGLMEHDEVVTLFHEFGHLVHHILGGRQRLAQFSGVATEWDFVEAPSQMLEEWAWDAGVLRSFATDASGAPIPAELVARMREAEEFGKGYMARTQMFYAAVSYRFHQDRPADLTATLRELQDRYDLFGYTEGTHFHTSFGHLEGYSSAYYTYMWSQVIAKDMFSAFDPADLMAPGVAGRYRDAVLARGGSDDAADLVADFLGRPYTFDAFRAWLDS